MRRGKSLPPIDVYRIGELHFVEDGHHRVSVARQLGLDAIEANVTEIVTEVGAGPETLPRDLPIKSHERLFFERVPLPPAARERIKFSAKWRYGELAEMVEAWGARAMHERGEYINREQVAREWFAEEYVPAVELLREADLIGRGTEAEAYMRIAGLRYLLLSTHEWTDEIIDRLREELRRPPTDDTMVHDLVREQRRASR
jgi:hypothetical protein